MVTITDPELRRRINQNLRELADGTVARRKEAERAARVRRKEQAKEQAKEDKKEVRRLKKRLAAVEEERDGLQEYLDELLLREDPNPLGYAEGMDEQQYNGLLEECDAAVEGCNNEIGKLRDRIELLERMIEND